MKLVRQFEEKAERTGRRSLVNVERRIYFKSTSEMPLNIYLYKENSQPYRRFTKFSFLPRNN